MKENFDIKGMSCSACSSKIQNKVGKIEGVTRCGVNLLTNSMAVEFSDANTLAEIIESVEKLGYGISKKGEEKKTGKNVQADEIKNLKTRLIVSFLFLIPLMYVAMGHMAGLPLPEFFLGMENAVSFAFLQFLLCIPVLVVNKKFFKNGFFSIFKLSPNMDSLIAVGSTAALGYGIFEIFAMSHALGNVNMEIVSRYHMDLYFETAAMIPALITLGKYLEARSKGKTSSAIDSLINLSPKKAIVLRNDNEVEINTEDIAVGDVVCIKPGMTVPCDGHIIFGTTSIDESMLTGESIPVNKEIGDKATTATLNISGYIRISAEKVGENTAFYEIIHLIEEASAKKAPISKLADKIAGIFVPVVMFIALVTFFSWLKEGFEQALSFGICVLVISCPCALGLATPVAVMVGTGKGAENGILIKSGEALEICHKIDTVVFDKTGTITEGKPTVCDIFGDNFLEIAHSLEAQSEHPIAVAVCQYCEKNGIKKADATDFEALTGLGVKGKIDNKEYFGGAYKLVKEMGILTEKYEKYFEKLTKEGKTVVFFSDGEKIIGSVAVSDRIKSGAHHAVKRLLKMGIKPVMLTGDNEAAAGYIAKQAGIDEVIANVLPDEKEKVIRKLKEDKKCVAMVGDGINDAPSLVSADVGMAMAKGTDVAIESADIVLMRNDLEVVPNAILLSKKVVKNIKENLFWAFFYNAIGIPVAAGVFYNTFGIRLNPMLGALAMSLSSVCVVTNALRLRGVKFKEERVEKKMKKVMIDGMMCMHCVGSVKKALAENGIEADVSLEEKCAYVDENIPDEKLKEIVDTAGYIFVGIE